MLKLLTAPSLLLLTLLSACGGGGDGEPPAVVCSNIPPLTESPKPPVPVCASPSSGTVTVSGTVRFQRVHHNAVTSGLDYTQVTNDFARGVTVELVNSNTNSVIRTTTTDGSGFYSLTAPDNTAVYIRAKAEMTNSGSANWTVRVVDNTHRNALYAIAGDDNCTGITDSSSYNEATRQAGPFAILDTIYQGLQLVIDAQSTISFPTLNIKWSPYNSTTTGTLVCGEIGTSFFSGSENAIYLLGAEDDDTDEYDQHVIAHEWGHYLESNFSRTDSIGGPHSFGDSLDMRVAFGEGYGNAFSAMALNDPVYKDSIGYNQASGFDFNIETETLNNPGWFSEQSVEQILYDLYDSTNETNTVVTDNVTLGFASIWEVLTNQQKTGLPLTSIFSFISALKTNNPGDITDIDALVSLFDINGTDAFGLNETNDANTTSSPNAVLPVYTVMAVDDTPVNICVTDEFDDNETAFNRLGARRFLRFTIPATRSYRFNATGVSGDPDMVLHKAGVLFISQAVGTSETFDRNLTAGNEYILEIYDYDLFTPRSNPDLTRCFAISITSN